VILGPAEAGLLFLMAAVAALIGILGALWPRVLAWPLAFVALWSGTAWAVKGIALRRGRRSGARAERLEDAMQGTTVRTDAAAGGSAPRPLQTQDDDARDRVTSR